MNVRIKPSDEKRMRLIRLIHVARRDLALDEETYRAMLEGVTGKTSSADMNNHELNRVLEHMKRKGFKVRPAASAAPSRALAQFPQALKIRALWRFLHQLGAVRNPSEAALAAYVKRLTGVDALQWITGEQAARIIETLKKWAERVKALERAP